MIAVTCAVFRRARWRSDRDVRTSRRDEPAVRNCRMAVRVGIDTGGTFTDLVAVDDAGGSVVAKVPSNPDDPVATIASVLRESGIDPAHVESVVVGTTIGINA